MIAKKSRGRPPGAPTRKFLVSVPIALDSRASRQAERLGLSLGGYIRQALSLAVERDEATDPGRS